MVLHRPVELAALTVQVPTNDSSRSVIQLANSSSFHISNETNPGVP
jgi:hypothetical protein